jgi:predicted metal-dependent peptidase
MTKLEDQDWVINPNTGNKVDMKKLLTEQRLAMIYIDSNFPFFSSLLRNLKWIYTFQVQTQATDGTRLLVNPEFTSKLSIKMKAFVMMHEVMHCALDHMARGKNHDPHKSNVAADYEVNGLLESDGVVSKNDLKPYLFDEKYQGMSYEHIYVMNPKDPGEQDMQQGGQQGSGQSQDGGGGQQGGGQSQEQGPSDSDIDKMSGKQAAQSAQESANRAKEQSANAQHNGSKKDAEKARDAAERAQRAADQAKDAANKGDDNTARQKAKEARDAANEAQSAANGGQQGQGGKQGNSQASAKHRQEAASASTPAGGFISQEAGAAIAESEGYSNEDCKVESASKISQNWKDTVIEACSKSNGPGAGNMVSRFKEYYMTSHDWKSDLKKYMGKALSNIELDTKLGKKKWLAQDQIKKYDKPAEGELDSVIFLIDCSGSVSDKLLQSLVSECYTICKRKKISKVTYCYYEDGITQMETNDTMKSDGILNPSMVSKIKKGNAMPKGEIHGRGGNNEMKTMKELEAILKKSHKKPELVMWFTDGYAYNGIPSKPRNIKHMIWVVYDNLNFETPDGTKVIHIKSEDVGK